MCIVNNMLKALLLSVIIHVVSTIQVALLMFKTKRFDDMTCFYAVIIITIVHSRNTGGEAELIRI